MWFKPSARKPACRLQVERLEGRDCNFLRGAGSEVS
jgi:hypothetical protein